MSSLKQQIESARKGIRDNKKHCPWIYPQYHNMNNAKIEMEQAIEKYKQALSEWEKLGCD